MQMPPLNPSAAQGTQQDTPQNAPQDARLLVCHECDALQCAPVAEDETIHAAHHIQPYTHRHHSHCWRCHARLEHLGTMHIEPLLALLLAALILFVIANCFPLFTLDLQGVVQQTSLFGAVRTLWQGELPLVSLLVFATTLLAPALDILALLYVLSAFHWGHADDSPGIAGLLRLQAVLQPWSMIEVFMLGTLVALVKLSHVADIHVGVAVWAFAAVMLLLAAVNARLDVRQLWQRLPVQCEALKEERTPSLVQNEASA